MILVYLTRYSSGFKGIDSYTQGSLSFLLDFKGLIVTQVLAAISLFKLASHIKCILYAEEDFSDNIIKITIITVISFVNCLFHQVIRLELLKTLDVVSTNI